MGRSFLGGVGADVVREPRVVVDAEAALRETEDSLSLSRLRRANSAMMTRPRIGVSFRVIIARGGGKVKWKLELAAGLVAGEGGRDTGKIKVREEGVEKVVEKNGGVAICRARATAGADGGPRTGASSNAHQLIGRPICTYSYEAVIVTLPIWRRAARTAAY